MLSSGPEWRSQYDHPQRREEKPLLALTEDLVSGEGQPPFAIFVLADNTFKQTFSLENFPV